MNSYRRILQACSGNEAPKTHFRGRIISVNPLKIDIGVINIDDNIHMNADIEPELGNEVLVLTDGSYSEFYVICKLRG